MLYESLGPNVRSTTPDSGVIRNERERDKILLRGPHLVSRLHEAQCLAQALVLAACNSLGSPLGSCHRTSKDLEESHEVAPGLTCLNSVQGQLRERERERNITSLPAT